MVRWPKADGLSNLNWEDVGRRRTVPNVEYTVVCISLPRHPLCQARSLPYPILPVRLILHKMPKKAPCPLPSGAILVPCVPSMARAWKGGHWPGAKSLAGPLTALGVPATVQAAALPKREGTGGGGGNGSLFRGTAFVDNPVQHVAWGLRAGERRL